MDSAARSHIGPLNLARDVLDVDFGVPRERERDREGEEGRGVAGGAVTSRSNWQCVFVFYFIYFLSLASLGPLVAKETALFSQVCQYTRQRWGAGGGGVYSAGFQGGGFEDDSSAQRTSTFRVGLFVVCVQCASVRLLQEGGALPLRLCRRVVRRAKGEQMFLCRRVCCSGQVGSAWQGRGREGSRRRGRGEGEGEESSCKQLCRRDYQIAIFIDSACVVS